MSLTFYWAISVFLMAFGGILLFRKKIMLWRGYDMLFIIVVINYPSLSLSIISWPLGHIVILVIAYLLLILLFYFLSRGRYTIYNVNAEMVSYTLNSVLKGEGIRYEIDGNIVILEDNENRTIKFKQSKLSMNSVEIDFSAIIKLPIYEKIRGELRMQIKQIETTVFSISGIFTFALGVILLSVVQFVNTK